MVRSCYCEELMNSTTNDTMESLKFSTVKNFHNLNFKLKIIWLTITSVSYHHCRSLMCSNVLCVCMCVYVFLNVTNTNLNHNTRLVNDVKWIKLPAVPNVLLSSIAGRSVLLVVRKEHKTWNEPEKMSYRKKVVFVVIDSSVISLIPLYGLRVKRNNSERSLF